MKKVIIEEEDENGEFGAEPKPHQWNAVLIAMAAVAGIGSLGAAVYSVRPQDPILDVKNITLSGFNLRTSTESLLLAVIDIDLTLYVKIVNNNIAPITFTTTIMNIYYRGSLLGQAKVSLSLPPSLLFRILSFLSFKVCIMVRSNKVCGPVVGTSKSTCNFGR